jgi:hypothetical protein
MSRLFGILIGGWELVLILAGFACMAFWVWMIVDCAVHEPRTGARVAWLLVIILGWIVGAPLYYFARKVPRYFAAKNSTDTHAPVA